MAVPLGYVIVGLTATSTGTAPVLLTSAVLIFLASIVLFAVPSQWTIRRLPTEATAQSAAA
ncbi:hypothetical protein ACWCRF_06285 [Streptomyces sp. NPDC002405]|uniref:hypothetical protein n=1 Tax=Streptomyces sp. NPDC001231 TaxID=3364549 RepID=UPI0036CC72F0